MKRIPFNLERCIAGDEVVTRFGDDYVFGAYNEKMNYQLLGWIGKSSKSHTANGEVFIDKRVSHDDLFMKPKKITRWIYVDETWGYATKEEAVSKHIINPENIDALIKIEFYEGENLE